MRYSQLFHQTLRDTPGEAILPGDQYLQRAGFIHPLNSNSFIVNPLGQRSLLKLANLIRQKLSSIDGQEISIPSVQTIDMFMDGSGYCISDVDLMEFSDLSSRKLFITNSSLPLLPELVTHSIRSHRQLPRLLFQIQSKLRNNNQTRTGLFSSRQVNRLEIFILDKDQEGATQQSTRVINIFQHISTLASIPIINVKFDSGQINGQSGVEFFNIHPNGESTLLNCQACGFLTNQKYAQSSFKKNEKKDIKSLEKVHTPETKTIEDLARFLNISKSETAKAVFMTASVINNGENTEKVVMAILRGDKELDEHKLLRSINAWKLRPSNDAEIESIGAVPGFASPVGLKKGLIVVDTVIPDSKNLVAGANQKDFHLLNVNYPRDFEAHIISDISKVQIGDSCPNCQQPLISQPAFLLGRINYANTFLCSKSNCQYQDENAVMKPIWIGSAWLDLEPIIGCVAENNHDNFGLVWPLPLSPFSVHLIVLPSKNSDNPVEVAEKLFQDLKRARIEVLFDDRKESPGVKFNDADLIGCPVRITVAEKSLSQGLIEIKLRHEQEKTTIPLDDAIPTIMHLLLKFERDFAQKLAK